MVNIDATTPQLRVLKEWADAIASRDLSNAEPILSKDFVMETFPKVPEIPDFTKEQYLQGFGAILAVFAKAEVTFREVIEAPGKVVAHHSTLFTTVDGTTIDYECVLVISLVNEDGKLKVLAAKDFADPEKRRACKAEAERVLAKGAPIA